jgi:Protein of unknown function (DUF4242)
VSGDGTSRDYLVECYWPGVSVEKLAAVAERAQEAARELRRHGRGLRFDGSVLVPEDETVFCFFDGEEADVRTASEQAGIPYERVLLSLRIDGEHQ